MFDDLDVRAGIPDDIHQLMDLAMELLVSVLVTFASVISLHGSSRGLLVLERLSLILLARLAMILGMSFCVTMTLIQSLPLLLLLLLNHLKNIPKVDIPMLDTPLVGTPVVDIRILQ